MCHRFITRFNAHLKSFSLLVLLGLALVFGGSIGCFGTYLNGCSPIREGSNAATLRPGVTANAQRLDVYMDIGLTGVFTPTTTTSGGVRLTTSSGELPIVFDDLAQNGYVAMRVPHAPPTYTTSSLIAGVTGAHIAEFSYYLPPTATIRTTVPITMVRRAELESNVNSRWPITDSHSHWEVWWLPPGDRFPIPDQPFRLKDEWPQPIEIMFRIDFGANTDARACAGCPIEVVTYNGYVFIGPYPAQIVIEDDPPPTGNPLVGFGARCGSPSIMQDITSTVPFTHTHWLESYDTLTRTYTIDAASSRSWNYTYFYQIPPNPPVPAGPPFNVTLGPKPDMFPFATCAKIMAVYTPTIAANDALRETFNITATSTVSPSVRASSVSFALGPAYTLREGQYRVLLPLVLKSN